jgi:hypothetical protein
MHGTFHIIDLFKNHFYAQIKLYNQVTQKIHKNYSGLNICHIAHCKTFTWRTCIYSPTQKGKDPLKIAMENTLYNQKCETSDFTFFILSWHHIYITQNLSSIKSHIFLIAKMTKGHIKPPIKGKAFLTTQPRMQIIFHRHIYSHQD